ncbi:MAG: TrpR-like protein YerC/YecD [Oscillospiraceae bacterium]|nr:TrpR-like protein YerC/YecD [Oscillospiraceae bacterium]
MEKIKIRPCEGFYRAVLSLETEEECRKFFDDICTIKELQTIVQRLDVARELDNGAVYAQASEATGASTATISRVNRCLLYGSGGYRIVLDREKEETK